MEITYYKNSLGEEMVLILDEANDKSESMTKAEYDRRQAQQVAQATLASELSNPSTPQAGE